MNYAHKRGKIRLYNFAETRRDKEVFRDISSRLEKKKQDKREKIIRKYSK